MSRSPTEPTLTDPNCIFCRIAARQSPAAIVFEDETVLAFRDRHPRAPVHILIIPRQHIPSLNEATREEESLLGHLLIVASFIARQQGIHERGYRLVVNTGSGGGQSVFHLHLHLMGDKPFEIY